MIREWAIEDKNATNIMRKADPPLGTDADAPPVPILSIEGSKRTCLAPAGADIFCGYITHFAVKDSILYGWGVNGTGALLGLPEEPIVDFYDAPTRLPGGVTGIAGAVASGAGTTIVLDDGTVLISGYPSIAPVGEDRVFFAFEPLDDLPVGAIAADGDGGIIGGAYYFLMDDGTVWGMGSTMPAQGPGIPSPARDWSPDATVPAQMPTDKVSDVVMFAAMQREVIFVHADNTVSIWGYFQENPLDLGAPPSGEITKVVGSGSNAYVLTDTGDIFSAGANDVGQYGNGTADGSDFTSGFHQVDGGPYADVAACQRTGFAIDDVGDIYSWGPPEFWSARGEPPVGPTEVHSPTLITGGPASGTWEALFTHWQTGTPMALHSSGCIYIWGYQAGGQLGRGFGTETVAWEPVQVLVSQADPPWPGP